MNNDDFEIINFPENKIITTFEPEFTKKSNSDIISYKGSSITYRISGFNKIIINDEQKNQ